MYERVGFIIVSFDLRASVEEDKAYLVVMASYLEAYQAGRACQEAYSGASGIQGGRACQEAVAAETWKQD